MSGTKRGRSSSPPSSQPPAPSLRSWLKLESKPPLPAPIVSSAPLTDRRSTFIAHACPVTNAHTAKRFHEHVRALRDPKHPEEADHEMLGWRTMELRPGKKGLSEDDFVTKMGGEDDGEKNGSNTIRKAIEEAGGVDCCVVVSRFYGGIMLGPDRFTHIRAVTIQALAALATAQAVPGLLKQLRQLDQDIFTLTRSTGGATGALPTYDDASMSEEKAERLIKAREMRLGLLRKKREQMPSQTAPNGKGDAEHEEKPSSSKSSKQPPTPAVETVYAEVEEENEEAEAERAMQAYLAERAAAKAAKQIS